MEAKKLPYLWEVRKGDKSSLVCGTQHVVPYDYSTSISELLEGKKFLLVERTRTDIDLERYFSSDATGSSLEKVLKKEELKKLDLFKPYFEKIFGSEKKIEQLTPFSLYNIIGTKLCKEFFFNMESNMRKIAQEKGIPVIGLETLEERIYHAKKNEELFIRRLKKYLNLIFPSTNTKNYSDVFLKIAISMAGEFYASGNLDFFELRINKKKVHRSMRTRNRRIVKRCEPYLEWGDAFIAVGLVHLIGKSGILKELEKRGYEVRRIFP